MSPRVDSPRLEIDASKTKLASFFLFREIVLKLRIFNHLNRYKGKYKLKNEIIIQFSRN